MFQSQAFVHPEAKIAKSVIIEPFSVISKDVEIGEGTWIGPNVTIMDGARIGKNCKIFPGAVISGVPQDLKYKGEQTTAHIGDNTVVRECVTIHKGTDQRMKTVVGSNCLIMAYCHIAHDCIVGDGCIFSNNATLAGHVVVGDNVNIGGLVAVQQFCEIGSYAFITGGSMVRKDVPPFVKVAREPLSYVGVNSVGMERRGISNEKIDEIKKIYREIFQTGHNVSHALQIIKANFEPTPQRNEIIEFIEKSSKKGIIKGITISKHIEE